MAATALAAKFIPVKSDTDDLKMLQVAREIAMDIHELGDILQAHNMSFEEWEDMKENPRFVALLAASLKDWRGASNVQERIRLKSAYLLEEYLPVLNRQLSDDNIAMSAKVEAVKLLEKMAGVAKVDTNGAEGPRFSFTLNIGNSPPIQASFTLPGNTIDHEPSPYVDVDNSEMD